VILRRRRVLSLPAFALLAGCSDLVGRADKPGTTADDVATLNAILGLEYQAIGTYDQVTQLLAAERQRLAQHFRADHQAHAEGLTRSIERLDGRPVAPQPARGLEGQLRQESDALRLLAASERGLAEAYLGAVPALGDHDMARAAAAILAVEASHWARWREALGEPPIAPFLTG
jgi:bacterioferritin (cytochrome b1)